MLVGVLAAMLTCVVLAICLVTEVKVTAPLISAPSIISTSPPLVLELTMKLQLVLELLIYINSILLLKLVLLMLKRVPLIEISAIDADAIVVTTAATINFFITYSISCEKNPAKLQR
jgi:hypothetical protein